MRWRSTCTILMAGLIFLCIYAVLNAGRYLSSPARQPVKADAMIILGGDAGARTLRGIDIYRKGFTQRIVLTGLDDGEPGAQRYYLNWRARMLLDAGVPQRSLEYDLKSTNSWEEAQNTLKRARQAGWKTVLVVSDPPHMRRLKWVWGKVFQNSDVTYVLVEGKPSWWKPGRWWENEISGKFVISEYIKIAYYLILH